MPENWLRRHAIQIVAQLPDSPEDALVVLELSRALVEGFLKVPQAPVLERVPASVVPFPASSSSR
jgi:hypothetical protein